MTAPQRSPLAIALLISACSGGARDGADLVLRNGAVWTVDSLRPTAEAVAVTAGRFVFVGSNAGADSLTGRNTRVVDLTGRMLLPGFVDSHVHPVTGGVELGECNLNPVTTPAELRSVVAECGRKNPQATWVRGGGFQLPLFPNGSPTKELLDSLIPDRPAFLTSADGHNGWVNTRALAIAGITRETRDPPNGVIVRDAAGGPGGTLRESAQDLVTRHLPARSASDWLEGLRRALALAARFGITTWHEASGNEDLLRAYVAADSLGELTVRTVVSLTVDSDSGPEQVARLAALREKYMRAMVRPTSAKIFADGVIEGGTAALLAPYRDRPGYRGDLNLPPERYDAVARALDSAGFRIHVHAIGDRAIRATFDALEQRHGSRPASGPMPLMAHIQLFDPTDIPRFKSLGVVASFQPLWAFRDDYITKLTEPRLGPERSRWLYPIASVVKTGAVVAGGSDWSVSSLNPLEAIQVGVTRLGLADSTGAPWLPDERVDLATMLKAYTLGGAIASSEDSASGTITVGKRADLIVVSQNLFKVPPHAIARSRVVLTLLGGREVWRDSTAIH